MVITFDNISQPNPDQTRIAENNDFIDTEAF
jgi:hypothetical protein